MFHALGQRSAKRPLCKPRDLRGSVPRHGASEGPSLVVVLTHADGRVFKMSGGKPTVNVYGGTMTAAGESGQMFHASASSNTVAIAGGEFTMSGLFSNGSASKILVVSGLGDGCTARFSTTASQTQSLADFCDYGYEPVKDGDWYVVMHIQPWPEDWPDADDAVMANFAKWRNGSGADAVLSTDDAKDAFLLNVGVDGIKELVIESIDVDADGNATVAVGAPGAFSFDSIDLGDINGVLYVIAGDTLDTMEPKAVPYWTMTSGKANVSFLPGSTGNAYFIRAALGFRAPTVDPDCAFISPETTDD